MIYNENCVDTMFRLPANCIDMTLTSPPYDDLRDYNGYSFDVLATAQGLYRAMKSGGVVIWIVNDRTKNGDETGTSFNHALTFKKVGFKLWDTMIFAKNNPFPGDCGKRYRQVFEYIFVFTKTQPQTFNPIEIASAAPGKAFSQARLERTGRRYYRGPQPIVTQPTRKASNIFFYSVGVNGNDLKGFKHPAVFPEALAKDQILSWSNVGDLVYDPFLGSGTTAKVAKALGRNYIGSEVSAEYVELAKIRII